MDSLDTASPGIPCHPNNLEGRKKLFKTLASTICAALCIAGVSSAYAKDIPLFSGTTVAESQLADTGKTLGRDSSGNPLDSATASGESGVQLPGAGNTIPKDYAINTTPSEIVDNLTNTLDILDPNNHFLSTGLHTYVQVSWSSGYVLTNRNNYDFEVGHQGSTTKGPEGILASVRVLNGDWTQWLWVTPKPPTSSGSPYYYSQYDLTSFGLSGSALIDAIRITNTIAGQTRDGFNNSINGGTGFVAERCSPSLNYIAALSTLETPPVPEPAGLLSLGCGALGLLGFVTRRRRA